MLTVSDRLDHRVCFSSRYSYSSLGTQNGQQANNGGKILHGDVVSVVGIEIEM